MNDISLINDLQKKTGIVIHHLTGEVNLDGQALNYFYTDEENYITKLSLSLHVLFIAGLASLKTFSRLTEVRLIGSGNEDIRSLTGIRHVSSLTLEKVTISEVNLLGDFESLRELILLHVNIADISFLKSGIRKPTGLSKLVLRGINLTDILFLRPFKNLTHLDLANNSISDISGLVNLPSLQSLLLGTNLIENISPVTALKNLTTLDLSFNDLKNSSLLAELTSLVSLNLTACKLKDGSFIQKLPNLTTLGLANDELSDSSFLKPLIKLQVLDLKSNQLSTLDLTGHSSLSTLIAANNFLTGVTLSGNIRRLNLVDLSDNKISEIQFLRNIEEVDVLNLRRNNLSGKIRLELMKVNTLDLSYNKIEEIGFRSSLKELNSVILSNNRLNSLSFLDDISKVNYLDLANNNLSSIPEFIFDLLGWGSGFSNDRLSLNHLSVKGNNLETPPISIIQRGYEDVKNYFRQIKEQGEEVLYEAKILIVGEGGAGKSTLFMKLQDPELLLPDTFSTLGVDIKEGQPFEHPSQKNVTVKGNLWDFGGQEIQYQLHQYFITPDSLYILVADNRKQHTRWDYWFQIIRLLGGKSHVLVVINNNKTISLKSSFPREEYKKNFKELTIEDFDVDFSQNNANWRFLLERIRVSLSELPLVNKPVPSLWKPLRAKLEEERRAKNYIPISRYFEICQDIGIKEDAFKLQALNYFHAIGIVLHFEKDVTLKDIVFLNPNWITKGLYSALNKTNTEIENGCFTKEWIEEYWKSHENKYSYEDRTYLLRLMLKDKFDICYPLDDDAFYMVPMLLPDDIPAYEFEQGEYLYFRFQYPFMPEGLISRLMVRLHGYISDGLLWKNGVVFSGKTVESKSSQNKKTEAKLRYTKAEVIQTNDTDTGLKYIGIRVSAEHLNERKDFLYKIREQLYYIHETSFKEMRYSEMVACSCEKCRKSNDPIFYPLEKLQILFNSGNFEKQCDTGANVPIIDLIGAVYSSAEIDAKLKAGKINYHIDMEPTPQKEDHKKIGTMLALLVFSVCFILIIGSVVVLSYLKISITWFIAAVIFEILAISAIWSFAVSPNEISENGAIKSFDGVLRKLNILQSINPKK